MSCNKVAFAHAERTLLDDGSSRFWGYVGQCSCGWKGPIRRTMDTADTDVTAHRMTGAGAVHYAHPDTALPVCRAAFDGNVTMEVDRVTCIDCRLILDDPKPVTKRPIEELRAEQYAAALSFVGRLYWRHKKTGHEYILVCLAFRESDGVQQVVYLRDGVTWARPLSEFLERFERVE